jgi:hypothetical protein
MIRTQIYLTDEEKNGLELIATAKGVSQSDLIRQAIGELLARTGTIDRSAALSKFAGVWSGRTDIPDVRELHAGWNRRPTR